MTFVTLDSPKQDRQASEQHQITTEVGATQFLQIHNCSVLVVGDAVVAADTEMSDQRTTMQQRLRQKKGKKYYYTIPRLGKDGNSN